MASKLEQSMIKDSFVLEVKKVDKVNMTKKSNGKYIKGNKKGKLMRRRCIKCRRVGHAIAECKSHWKCLKCDGYGHKASECKKNGTDRARNKVNMADASNRDETIEREHEERQQKKNFAKKEKVNMVKDADDELLIVEADLQGAHLKRVVFDIRATISILAERVAKANNFRLRYTNTRIKFFDGRTIKAKGTTNRLVLDVLGHRTRMSFTVVDVDDYDMLIGMDYFKRTGVGIYPKQRLLRYPNEDVLIPENNESSWEERVFLARTVNEEQEEDEVAPEEFVEYRTEDITTEIQPKVELSNDIATKFQRIVPLIKRNAASSLKDLNGGCKVGEFNIKIRPEFKDKVIFRYPYKKSEKEKLELKKILKELEEAGIISVSTTPHNSPTHLVRKKDGKYRLVIDFRELNSMVEKKD